MTIRNGFYVIHKCYVIAIFLYFQYIGPLKTFFTLLKMLNSNLKSKIYSYVIEKNYVIADFLYLAPIIIKEGRV